MGSKPVMGIEATAARGARIPQRGEVKSMIFLPVSAVGSEYSRMISVLDISLFP